MMKSYLRDIKNIPLLDPEEIPILCEKIDRLKELLGGELKAFELKKYSEEDQLEIKDCLSAYHRFIKGNLRLVILIAKKYRKSDFELENLVQFGNIGLIKAVEKFDYSKGKRFNVYASFWIKQAISRGITNTHRTIRLPIHISERLAKIKRETRNNSHPVNLKELSDKINLSVEDILFILEKDYVIQSSNIQCDGGAEFEDTFTYEEESEDGTVIALTKAFEVLDDTEIKILELKLGLIGKPKTFTAISKELSITSKDIEEIYSKAIEKLSASQHLKAFYIK